MIKISIIILLKIFLVSCEQIPYAPVKNYSFKFQKCLVLCFNYNKLETVDDRFCGEDFISGDYHVSECDNIIGPDAGIYAKDIRPVAKKNITASGNRN